MCGKKEALLLEIVYFIRFTDRLFLSKNWEKILNFNCIMPDYLMDQFKLPICNILSQYWFNSKDFWGLNLHPCTRENKDQVERAWDFTLS